MPQIIQMYDGYEFFTCTKGFIEKFQPQDSLWKAQPGLSNPHVSSIKGLNLSLTRKVIFVER